MAAVNLNMWHGETTGSVSENKKQFGFCKSLIAAPAIPVHNQVLAWMCLQKMARNGLQVNRVFFVTPTAILFDPKQILAMN